MLDYINDFMDKTLNVVNIPNIQIVDILEILIISVLIYQLTKRIADTRIFTVTKGILVMLALYGLLIITHLDVIASIFQWFIVLCLICIVLACQPEIKRIMESTGSKNYLTEFINWWKRDKDKNQYLEFSDDTLDAIVEACDQMSKAKTGALMVFELDTPLKDIVATGIKLDALITKQLLIQIFEKNTPLHDGAIVIKHDRVESATCYLPLSNNLNINKDLGTRHRAGIGVTEQVDCLVVIVSEETGAISYVRDGNIRHKVSLKELRLTLNKIQHRKDSKKKAFESVKNIRFKNIRTKIISVIGGVLVWFTVLSIIDPVTTRRFTDIKVDVINGDIITSAEQTYEVLNNNNISLIIKGRRSVIDDIKTTDIEAVADINDMSKVYNVPIQVSLKNGFENYAEITYKSNDNIKIMIDTISEKVLKVEYEQLGTLTDGTYISDISSSTNVVTIKGANTVVSTIDKVVLPIDISGQTESFTSTVKPKVYDRNGEEIQQSKIDISETNFDVNVRMLNTKTVPLKVNIVNNDESAYRVVNYSVEKDDVTIGADDETLEGTEDIGIDIDISEDINNITSNKLVKTIDLTEFMPDGIVVANKNTKLNIDIEIETPVEKEFKIRVDDIEIKRLNSKFDCTIADKEYTVKIKGYEEDLAGLGSSDLSVVLDIEYSKVKEGSKELLVNINTDINAEVIEIPVVEYTLD